MMLLMMVTNAEMALKYAIFRQSIVPFSKVYERPVENQKWIWFKTI